MGTVRMASNTVPSSLFPFSSSTSTVKKRVSKPKTRTGCLTCKARRVKCDETHPSCLRCLSYSGNCDGYIPKAHATHSTPRTILPAQQMSRPLILPRVISEGRFRNDVEQFYFRSFQSEIAPGLTGAHTSSIWDQIMLQASHQEQFVHDAVIAISALSISLKLPFTATSKHHQVAMKYYDCAVKSMRNNLSSSPQDLRKALLSCLLVYCFESLEGDQTLTISYARSGLAMLRSAIPEFKIGSLFSTTLIEDDIVIAFRRIDLQVFLMADSELTETYQGGRTKHAQDDLDMPPYFKSVPEADRYWQIVMQRAGYFVYRAMVSTLSGAQNTPSVDESSSDIGTCSDTFAHTTSDSNWLEIKHEQRVTMAELFRWEEAFEPLRLSFDATIRAKATFRRITAISIRILVTSILFKYECSCDRFLSDYREMVSLSQKFIRQESSRKFPISYDLGIIPALYVLNKSCRHSATRREAIALLRDSPWREGIWDSRLVADVSEWLMLKEEEGLEGDFIPEHARIKITDGFADSRAKVFRLTWTRMASKEDFTRIERKSVIPWNGGIHANLSVAK